jgi:hypothetical protein
MTTAAMNHARFIRPPAAQDQQATYRLPRPRDPRARAAARAAGAVTSQLRRHRAPGAGYAPRRNDAGSIPRRDIHR